jgi:hypothetical protein
LNEPEASVKAFRTATVLDSLSEYAFAHLGQAYFQLGIITALGGGFLLLPRSF